MGNCQGVGSLHLPAKAALVLPLPQQGPPGLGEVAAV